MNGIDGADGKDGKDGADGKDGVDGKDGTQVTESETNGHINLDGVDTTVYNDTALKTALSDASTTIEGNPLSFTTLSAQTAESTLIDLEPIQDLHGYDKPWVGGAGKNLAPMTVEDLKSVNNGGTWNGNTLTLFETSFTILTDANNNVIGIKINSLSAAEGNRDFKIGGAYGTTNLFAPSGTYTMSLEGANSSIVSLGGYGNNVILNNTTMTTASCPDGVSFFLVRLNQGSTVSNVVVKPMLRKSTETDSSFAPYTNICPISGRSSVDLNVAESQSAEPTQELTISLGQTVYGAQIDLEKGECVVEWKKVIISGGITAKDFQNKLFQLAINDIESWTVDTPTTYLFASYLSNYTLSSLRANEVFGICQYSSNAYIRLGSDITEISDANTYLSNNNLEICYKLATPTTITLTPQAINLLKGNNYISTSGDKITLTYRTGEVATLGDLTEAEKELGTAIKALQVALNYSTTEHVVGTWIDGKPLYEITWDWGAGPQPGNQYKAHNIPNIKYIYHISAIAIKNDYFDVIPKDSASITFTSEYVNIYSTDGSQLSTVEHIYMTIRYTKTTDYPVSTPSLQTSPSPVTEPEGGDDTGNEEPVTEDENR